MNNIRLYIGNLFVQWYNKQRLSVTHDSINLIEFLITVKADVFED